jgi:pimeloyl-ACP methyl ester carboxylesterase
VELQGTLTLPQSPKKSKAVVLISGSGGNDRDQLIYGHRVFLVLADYLTRQGIAVLRFDDRGIGRSLGNYDEATFENFINDAMAAHEYLKSRKEIDPNQTGLLGHSEGAAIAILASSVPESVSFVVLLSAPALGFSDSERGLIDQFTNDYRNNGASEEAIQFKSDLLFSMFIIARDEYDVDVAKTKIDELLISSEAALMELSEEDRVAIETESIETYDYDWFLSTRFLNILRYQPEPALSNIQCPLLALHGKKDVQISYDNISEIEKMVMNGGNDHCTVLGFEDVNHLFQRCETGQESEYVQIEETMAPEVLSSISDWINETVR